MYLFIAAAIPTNMRMRMSANEAGPCLQAFRAGGAALAIDADHSAAPGRQDCAVMLLQTLHGECGHIPEGGGCSHAPPMCGIGPIPDRSDRRPEFRVEAEAVGPAPVLRPAWPGRGLSSAEAAALNKPGMGCPPIWTRKNEAPCMSLGPECAAIWRPRRPLPTIYSSRCHAHRAFGPSGLSGEQAASAASAYDSNCCPGKQSHIGS